MSVVTQTQSSVLQQSQSDIFVGIFRVLPQGHVQILRYSIKSLREGLFQVVGLIISIILERTSLNESVVRQDESNGTVKDSTATHLIHLGDSVIHPARVDARTALQSLDISPFIDRKLCSSLRIF